ncbi:hypothetical protein PG996_002668 [Apiospora saccharicola]|uniref:Uncharacterized protein n=1 Tax=Apiospora saccharicola TaxID=335842 RepID=A0ABR1WLI1_9PEZI
MIRRRFFGRKDASNRHEREYDVDAIIMIDDDRNGQKAMAISKASNQVAVSTTTYVALPDRLDPTSRLCEISRESWLAALSAWAGHVLTSGPGFFMASTSD